MTFDFASRCELSTTPRVIMSQMTCLFDVELQTLSEYYIEILHIWFVTFQSMDLKLWHELRCTVFGLIDDKDLDECIGILLYHQKENQMKYLKLLWLSTTIDYFDSSPLVHQIDMFLWPHIQNQSMKELYVCHQILPPNVESNVDMFIKKNDLISSTIRSVERFSIKLFEQKKVNFCVFLIVFIQYVSYPLVFHTQCSLEAGLSNSTSIILIYIKMTSVEAVLSWHRANILHHQGLRKYKRCIKESLWDHKVTDEYERWMTHQNEAHDVSISLMKKKIT